jgi:hypothetical protein
MLKVASVVEQSITELNGAVSEEAKVVAITKNCSKCNETRWPLESTGPSRP